MAKKLTAYQRKVIQRYYQNRDAIDAQKLAELVTDLYLATTPRRKAQLWGRARKLLERVPDMDAAFVDRLEAENDLETLAGIAEARFLGDGDAAT